MFDRDNDGALNFSEMSSLQRGLNGIALEYPGKYEEATIESGFANRDGWLVADGLTAYYERFGQLSKDIKDLGIGSLDDYVCANISLTGEIRSKVVQGIDKLFDAAREAHYKLKFANFISRFVKDFYLDWECKRLSDLFLKEDVPAFLKTPAGPSALLREWQKLLSDGRKGYIPDFREGVERALGKGWGWSDDGEWDIVSEEEEASRVAESERESVAFVEGAAAEKGINVSEFNISTMQGWKDFTLADGSKPLWLREALQHVEEEREMAEKMKESDTAKYSEVTDVPRGTTDSIKRLQGELEELRSALSRPLPRRQREELMDIETTKRGELQSLESQLSRGVHVSSHHALKSYDALRSVCTGLHSMNWGNKAFTVRLEAEGFDFFHLLPPGIHEAAEISAEKSDKQLRAIERKREAKKFIVEQRKRKLLEAKEKEKLMKALADKKRKERAEEEQTLFTRGADARIRGYHKKADQVMCIEMWRRLHLLFDNRYDQNDAKRDIVAVAIAANNLGVVSFEFGDGRIGPIKEALLMLRKANTYIDETLKTLKEEAKQKHLAEFAEKRKVSNDGEALPPLFFVSLPTLSRSYFFFFFFFCWGFLSDAYD